MEGVGQAYSSVGSSLGQQDASTTASHPNVVQPQQPFTDPTVSASSLLIQLQQQQQRVVHKGGPNNRDGPTQHSDPTTETVSCQQPPTSTPPLLSAASYRPTPLSSDPSQVTVTSAQNIPPATTQLTMTGIAPTGPTAAQGSTMTYGTQAEEVYQFVLDLTVASKRERALLELSRRRESFADLAPILWHSFGVITAVLQEIVSIYLGVIGALVKVDDHEVIGFLLQTEIISLCLRIMEMGSELSKTVATFIVQKILLDELGLRYVCATAERFYALSSVLGSMVQNLVDQPSPRLIKHIVKCYLRLADNQRGREALKRCLPTALRQGSLLNVIREDPTTKQNVATLIDLIDHSSNGQFFDITSASDLLAQAQKQQKLQQLQQSLQGASGNNLQQGHQLLQQQQHQNFQQQQLQQAFQSQQLSSLLAGPSGLGPDTTGLGDQ